MKADIVHQMLNILSLPCHLRSCAGTIKVKVYLRAKPVSRKARDNSTNERADVRNSDNVCGYISRVPLDL